MEALLSVELWAALLTLTALEIVLGIDNLVFISILSGRLPEAQQSGARKLGLAAAVITRLLLLASVSWLATLKSTLFAVAGHPFSWRDLIMFAGGLFLLYKGTAEISETMEVSEKEERPKATASFAGTILQIMILDIVFSLDSVITAVGMSGHFGVMAAAIVIAVGIMMFAADPLSRFIHEHLSVKMLALSFLILVGFALVADSFHQEIPKGYLYFAIAFSVGVESLNIVARKRRTRAALRAAGNGTPAPDQQA